MQHEIDLTCEKGKDEGIVLELFFGYCLPKKPLVDKRKLVRL